MMKMDLGMIKTTQAIGRSKRYTSTENELIKRRRNNKLMGLMGLHGPRQNTNLQTKEESYHWVINK